MIEDCARRIVLLKLTTERRSIARPLCESRASGKIWSTYSWVYSGHNCSCISNKACVIPLLETFYCRAMLCISAASAVAWCPSVCPSCLWTVSKRINISSKKFSPSNSHTIEVFWCQTSWQCSKEGTGASNTCRVGKKSRFSTSDLSDRWLVECDKIENLRRMSS